MRSGTCNGTLLGLVEGHAVGPIVGWVPGCVVIVVMEKGRVVTVVNAVGH